MIFNNTSDQETKYVMVYENLQKEKQVYISTSTHV